jgi:hypothetical protein
MAKFKSPKTTDTNEAVSKIAAQPNAPNSPASETPATFAPATSTTRAESAKPKATRSRSVKTENAPSSVPPTSAAPRLEAVPSEGRTNGETRASDVPSKSEGRRNVVPINLEDEIRKVAYLLSERRGFAPGHEREDWLAAEREVMQRYRQHTA